VKRPVFGTRPLEPFHFEKALTNDGGSLVRANEEQAKFIFAANSECSVSKFDCFKVQGHEITT
jgi:hypothetical protein